jgi:hypothetical protein
MPGFLLKDATPAEILSAVRVPGSCVERGRYCLRWR